MGIQKDAAEVLIYLYGEKVAGRMIPDINKIQETTKWDEKRVIFAMEYLIRKGMVSGEALGSIGHQGSVFAYITDLTPAGIDTIENQNEFKNQFSHTINLGVYQFSWTMSDKEK